MVVSLIAALLLQTVGPVQGTLVHAAEELSANGYLDKIIFGSGGTEQECQFKGKFTSAITGALGEPAQVSNPRVPVRQNYFHRRVLGGTIVDILPWYI